MRPQKPVQSEVCFCASAKTAAEYLGGPLGLDIRISVVLSNREVENRTSRAVWHRCWKLVLGRSSRGWVFQLLVGAGKSYLGLCWVLENRTCGFVSSQKPLHSELFLCASAKTAAE